MSRADRFDRADFDVRYDERTPARSDADEPSLADPMPSPVSTPSGKVIWPIAREDIRQVGESVLADRNGRGRPHKGIDIFADAGTEVLAARGGQVLRVVDGRRSKRSGKQRAGLFVDVRGADARVYRYLHLGEARVKPGVSIKQGTVIGSVATAHTSGLADTPHLHFEIRQGDYDRSKKDYGIPVDPLRLLPSRRA